MLRLCAAVFVLVLAGQPSLADSESLEAARQQLLEIKEAGRIPGFADYVKVVNREDLQLTDVGFVRLGQFVDSLQEPEISREALAERIAAKRKNIRSYVIEAVSKPVGKFYSGRGTHRYKFAGDGNKRYQCHWVVPGDGQEFLRQTTSFDGQVVRQYKKGFSNDAFIYPELFRGGAHDFDLREDLTDMRANPIPSSMLIDCEAELGYFHPDLDLVAVLKTEGTIVYSERQEVEGHSYLVVQHFNTVVYLDPQLDHSVIRREDWHLEHGGGKIQSFRRHGFTTYADFQESGGVHLPTTITFSHPASGGRNTVVTVNKLTINGDVEESLYKDVTSGLKTFKIQDDGSVIPVDDE